MSQLKLTLVLESQRQEVDKKDPVALYYKVIQTAKLHNYPFQRTATVKMLRFTKLYHGIAFPKAMYDH